jgi:hypothetical protein
MKKLWLAAAMAASVAALQLPASAATVNGIPAQGPHGVHGIIIHHCRWHRCCHPGWNRRCGPHGIIIGRPIGRRPIGTRPIGIRPPIGRPIGVSTHGIGPVGPAHGGLVNGIPVQQQVQH